MLRMLPVLVLVLATMGAARVVDVSSDVKVVATAPLSTPQSVSIRPGTSELWVTNSGTDDVTVFDLDTSPVRGVTRHDSHAIHFMVRSLSSSQYVCGKEDRRGGGDERRINATPVHPNYAIFTNILQHYIHTP